MSIYLNIAPCSWNRCKFCAYEFLKKDGTPTPDEMKKLIDREMDEHVKKGQPYVKIFNGGSWFYNEVPRELRDVVYNYLEEINFKKLRVENTFNLIIWDEIKELVDRGFDLTISWGLEAANDRILKEVDKGVTIEKVGRMLKRAKDLGIKNLVYLLAGLPFAALPAGNFHIPRNHQWTDAGAVAGPDVLLPSFDYDGRPRTVGSAPDIGPFEAPMPASCWMMH